MTIQRRSEIDTNLNSQLIQKAHEFHYYSLAINESTYMKDTAQLLIYTRGVDKHFEITSELAGLCSMHDHIIFYYFIIIYIIFLIRSVAQAFFQTWPLSFLSCTGLI